MGHDHIVAFLKSLPLRSDAPSLTAKACKPSTSDERECANCCVGAGDRSDLLLKACSRCRLVYYCSKPCQLLHWKKGGHKRFCVAVGDRKLIKSNTTKQIEEIPTKCSQPVSDLVSFDDCAVCLEPLNISACVLACGHVFHHDCVAGVQFFGLSQKCPLCRSDLPLVGVSSR